MWRPDWLNVNPVWRRPTYFWRLGQAEFQLWRMAGRQFECLASRPSQHIGYSQYQAISDEWARLGQDLPAGAFVRVLVDSKWMPLSLIATGRKPLSGTQVEGLATHRFASLYGDQAQGWRVRTNYVSGDVNTLAFACPEGLLASLQPGTIKVHSCQPTFGWVWDHVWRRQAAKADNWLVWAEHDRSVLVRFARGQMVALQPAGPVLSSPVQLAAVLPIQALKCGLVEAKHTAFGVSWEAMPDMAQAKGVLGIRWHAVSAVESTS